MMICFSLINMNFNFKMMSADLFVWGIIFMITMSDIHEVNYFECRNLLMYVCALFEKLVFAKINNNNKRMHVNVKNGNMSQKYSKIREYYLGMNIQ